MSRNQGKLLAWLHGKVKSPPFSPAARQEAGWLLRLLKNGQSLALPHSRPIASIGVRCHELRVVDENVSWRIIYRLDPDEVVIVAVFSKSTQKTPKEIIRSCRQRLRRYDAAVAAGE
mgnify:CR=1 FL=1